MSRNVLLALCLTRKQRYLLIQDKRSSPVYQTQTAHINTQVIVLFLLLIIIFHFVA